MNVYDFDRTIFNGDSSIKFYVFCLKKRPKIILYFPKQVFSYLLMLLGLLKKETAKECFFSFLKGIENVSSLVDDFWVKEKCNIQNWYITQMTSEDLIISASPEFLLKPLCELLNVNLIATKVNIDTGKLLSKNCYGSEKRNRFIACFGIKRIDCFYSDSVSDLPLAELSLSSFLVCRGGEVKRWVK